MFCSPEGASTMDYRSQTETKTQNVTTYANGNGGRVQPDKPIPRKQGAAAAAKDAYCKLCTEYGGVARTHSTAQCKKWVPGGKPHPEWKGGTSTSNINVHKSGGDMKQLMAQQAEFQHKIFKQMNKLAGKKKKSKRRKRHSDSESSDSDY